MTQWNWKSAADANLERLTLFNLMTKLSFDQLHNSLFLFLEPSNSSLFFFSTPKGNPVLNYSARLIGPSWSHGKFLNVRLLWTKLLCFRCGLHRCMPHGKVHVDSALNWLNRLNSWRQRLGQFASVWVCVYNPLSTSYIPLFGEVCTARSGSFVLWYIPCCDSQSLEQTALHRLSMKIFVEYGTPEV